MNENTPEAFNHLDFEEINRRFGISLPQGQQCFDEISITIGEDGLPSVDRFLTPYACGCSGSKPGLKCGEEQCTNISCQDCSKRCTECSKALCIEHQHTDGDETLCEECKRSQQRKKLQELLWAVFIALLKLPIIILSLPLKIYVSSEPESKT